MPSLTALLGTAIRVFETVMLLSILLLFVHALVAALGVGWMMGLRWNEGFPDVRLGCYFWFLLPLGSCFLLYSRCGVKSYHLAE
jgi:hypothetical protein